jgi:hypothetical protein
VEFCDPDGYAELVADASELDAGVGFDEIVNFSARRIVEHGCGAFRNVSLYGECCKKWAPRSCD